MIKSEDLWLRLAKLYTPEGDKLGSQVHRWEGLIDEFQSRFGNRAVQLFSTPGRTEIGGNHTDHNHGKVLAASINLDSIAAASDSKDELITVYSQGYPEPFVVSLDELLPNEDERGTTTALIRGIASRFRESGYEIGGFNACITSNVLVASGLSSSASIEVLIGTIIDYLFNGGKVDPKTIAIIGQYSENNYFGKPCGLMDQIACAVGGIVAIDFMDPGNPIVQKVEFDFAREGYGLLVVDTGGNHEDLTEEYSSIPREMKSVAELLGKDVCRNVSEMELFGNLRRIRSTVGDRAFLRALHFVEENRRVDIQVNALSKGDFREFLRLVNESGNSSFKWLQNCFTAGNAAEQGVAVGLALTERFIKKTGAGACRVHGGGFAGTILVLLPRHSMGEYEELMESAFMSGCVKKLSIRSVGTVRL